MTKSKVLFEDEEEKVGNKDLLFKVNEKYAQKYQEKKRKEELSQLEEKYAAKLAQKGARSWTASKKDLDGSKHHNDPGRESLSTTEEEEEEDYEESDTSDAIEDEDGELVTPAVEAQILKTLADIRARDAKIYNPEVNFFSPEEIAQTEAEWQVQNRRTKSSSSNDKPFTLKDFHRKRLLTENLNGDNPNEDSVDVNDVKSDSPLKTHNQEQRELLQEFKLAADMTNTEDELLRVRPKTDQEITREDEQYKRFLLKHLADTQHAHQSMAAWFDNSNKEEALDEKFLIDYVLNRGWVERDRKKLPTYQQVIQEEEEDEVAVEAQEAFEERYNFRYEQPGGITIQTFARQVEGSLRRESNKRKEQRAARQARKADERARQQEELKRLKNLKQHEIAEKLNKIKSISGLREGNAAETLLSDFEEDFDPEAHDRKMQQLFGQSYYQNSDKEEELESKPIFSDNDFEGKTEFEGIAGNEEELNTKGVKQARRSLKKALQQSSQATSSQAITSLLDEYYQLDYEDMIEGIPCRFKYESVSPTTFGLKMRDILNVEDADLNAHVSLKKLAPYRSAEQQEADMNKYGHKKRLYKFYDLVKRKRQVAK